MTKTRERKMAGIRGKLSDSTLHQQMEEPDPSMSFSSLLHNNSRTTNNNNNHRQSSSGKMNTTTDAQEQQDRKMSFINSGQFSQTQLLIEEPEVMTVEAPNSPEASPSMTNRRNHTSWSAGTSTNSDADLQAAKDRVRKHHAVAGLGGSMGVLPDTTTTGGKSPRRSIQSSPGAVAVEGSSYSELISQDAGYSLKRQARRTRSGVSSASSGGSSAASLVGAVFVDGASTSEIVPQDAASMKRKARHRSSRSGNTSASAEKFNDESQGKLIDNSHNDSPMQSSGSSGGSMTFASLAAGDLRSNSIRSEAHDDVAAMKQRARGSRTKNRKSGNLPAVGAVAVQDTELDFDDFKRQEKERKWKDPLQASSDFCLVEMENSLSTMDPYTRFAQNPSFPSISRGSPQKPSADGALSNETGLMTNESEILGDETEWTMNAPVTHLSQWEKDTEKKSQNQQRLPVNRTLCFLGVCLIGALILGVSLGVSLKGSRGVGTSQQSVVTVAPTLAPVAPTMSPIAECTSTAASLSDRFVSLENVLGETRLDTPQRQALCWLADADELQVAVNASQLYIAQRYALAVIYYSTGGPNSALANWLSGETDCDWVGVDCYHDVVVSLDLQSKGLINTIPSELSLLAGLSLASFAINLLTGTIPEEIYDMPFLTSIDLKGNRLEGSISPKIGQLIQLETLDLESNTFTGSLPPELFQLEKLLKLAASSNRLEGSIPSSIGTLSRLTSLQVTRNRLTGVIPPQIGNCTALEHLDLGVNLMRSNLPTTLGALTNLGVLRLTTAGATGTIPSELGNLSGLTQLSIEGNGFLGGTIPSELGQLTALQVFNMEQTRLSGIMPSEVCTLRDLALINLSADCGELECSCCTYCPAGPRHQ